MCVFFFGGEHFLDFCTKSTQWHGASFVNFSEFYVVSACLTGDKVKHGIISEL